ncbi:hypothetical protein DFR70_1109 [Nocardia tenerifensis]|uniref:Small secreted domain DUF320 n=1 Tax=Nocardia tenerifensis TaxID=228006 RepID=A0A318JVD2_9NOCA|nr:hypothetical protein [Nocardia tenerifensis]PXX60169.1 hypothetical protein DFR70_1109 [Nocardia tenerifensis]
MKRVIANVVVAGAITFGGAFGAAQATAEPGLPLEPAAPAAAPVGEAGTGSADGVVKLLSELSSLSARGNMPCGPGGRPATGSDLC